MGSSTSTHKSDVILDHQPYPDMNIIFRGIPKMIQLADDIHRMTDYMMDIRNMSFALICITAISLIVLLIIRLARGQNNSARRKRDIGRRIEGLDDRSLSRHHTMYGTYQHGYADAWHEPREKSSIAVDIDKLQLGERKTSDDQTIMPINSKNLPNGQPHKKLDPIKLVVNDIPFMDK